MPLHPGSIRETFVMLMAKCIARFSLGEALEMAWKVIFKPLFTFHGKGTPPHEMLISSMFSMGVGNVKLWDYQI